MEGKGSQRKRPTPRVKASHESPPPVSEHETSIIFDSMSELLVYHDPRLTVLWANRAAADSVGLNRADLIGRRCYSIWHQRTTPCPGCPVVKALCTGETREADMPSPDGRQWWVRGHPVWKGGHVIGAIEIVLDVTAAREAEERIKVERDRLRREKAMRTRFISLLAHELRNPLMVLKSNVQLLKRDASALDRALARMEAELDTMRRLLQDLLDSSRICSGRMQLNKTLVDLCDIVKTVVGDFQDRTEGELAGPSIEAVLHGSAFVLADRMRLEQILTNLIDNAFKYTPSEGTISIHVGLEGVWAVLQIKDTGVGIDPKMLPYVFEPFVKVDNMDTAGLGLGLPISKSLVELHGGAIVIDSEGPNKGTVVTVTLPAILRPPQG